jgi:hypothetical protein
MVAIFGIALKRCLGKERRDVFSCGFPVIVPEPCCGDGEKACTGTICATCSRYAHVVGLEEMLASIAPAGRRND